MKDSAWMTPRARIEMEQDYKARAAERMETFQETATALEGKKWDNESYSPVKYGPFGKFVVGQMVQMVIENRDSPEPEVRPFLITQVLDASVGLVNGMLFMANSDIRAGEPGILGGGMSQAIRSAGFEVPNAVRGVFWLDRVRFHPVGIPRQQTVMVENPHFDDKDTDDRRELIEQVQWESPGVPLLEATWRWCQ